VSLTIVAADRIAGASGKTISFAFKTASLTGSQIPIGGKITLNYPKNFFVAGITPTIPTQTVSFSGVSAFGEISLPQAALSVKVPQLLSN